MQPQEVVLWAQENGFFESTMTCEYCSFEMILTARNVAADNLAWRCNYLILASIKLLKVFVRIVFLKILISRLEL
jgi:hypothetical protein